MAKQMLRLLILIAYPTQHVCEALVGASASIGASGYSRSQILGLPRPIPVTLEVQTEYLEATLGLVKCVEISKELIRECVTVPG